MKCQFVLGDGCLCEMETDKAFEIEIGKFVPLCDLHWRARCIVCDNKAMCECQGCKRDGDKQEEDMFFGLPMCNDCNSEYCKREKKDREVMEVLQRENAKLKEMLKLYDGE